jgi:hypothetical protein
MVSLAYGPARSLGYGSIPDLGPGGAIELPAAARTRTRHNRHRPGTHAEFGQTMFWRWHWGRRLCCSRLALPRSRPQSTRFTDKRLDCDNPVQGDIIWLRAIDGTDSKRRALAGTSPTTITLNNTRSIQVRAFGDFSSDRWHMAERNHR